MKEERVNGLFLKVFEGGGEVVGGMVGKCGYWDVGEMMRG